MDYEEMRAWMEQMRKANSLLLISHVSPDGDTIGRFRNILIKNGIQEKFFAMIVKKLTDEKLILETALKEASEWKSE